MQQAYTDSAAVGTLLADMFEVMVPELLAQLAQIRSLT